MPRASEGAAVHLPRFLAFIGLGGNVGDVRRSLASAAQALAALPWSEVAGVSSLYLTRPVQAEGPDFLNAVLALRSALGPQELLRALQGIERAHDRQRPFLNAPRTLDLDLLWFGGSQRHSSVLQLPHPRLAERAFVLEPLAEVIAQLPRSDAAELPDLPPMAQRSLLAKAQGISLEGPFPAALQADPGGV